MATLMLDTRLLLLMAAAILATSLIGAVATGDAHWFGRAGSLTTIFGLILMLKNNLLCAGRDNEAALVEKLHFSEPPPKPGTSRYVQAVRRARRILFDEYVGFMTTLLGTVIWGYGDLILGMLVG